MAEHYYTVGKHGAPTPETAPHGYKWRLDGPWICSGGPYEWHPENQWWPLPAPPIEEAPAPEPVKRWTVNEAPGREMARLLYRDCDVMAVHEAHRAADALNTLDATGIVWGEPRPMSELPKAGRVLVRHQNGGVYEREAKFSRLHGGPHWTGWYGPLPEVTP